MTNIPRIKTTSLEPLNLINFKRLFDAHFVKGNISCSRLAANRSHIYMEKIENDPSGWEKINKGSFVLFLNLNSLN